MPGGFLNLKNIYVKAGNKASDCFLHSKYIFLLPEARKLLTFITGGTGEGRHLTPVDGTLIRKSTV